MDAVTAFLNPALQEEVYMELPEGYTIPESHTIPNSVHELAGTTVWYELIDCYEHTDWYEFIDCY
jgi:hypothetical protein